MAYVDQAEDPYRSAYQKTGLQYILDFEEIFGRGVLGKVAERFPGGNTVRPVQIDQLYGEPVPVSPGFGPNGMNPLLKAIPFLPRTLDGSGDEAYRAIYEMTGGYKEYAPSKGTLELSVAQQQELNGIMGTMRIGGRTLSQAVMALRNRADVREYVDIKGKNVPPETGAVITKEVNKLRNKYGQAALARLMSGSTDLQKQQLLKATLKQQRNRNDLQGARSTSQQLNQLLEIAGVK